MKCVWCGREFEHGVAFYPVSPRGRKFGRKRSWMCEYCLSIFPKYSRTFLLKRGQKNSLTLELTILKNKIIDRLTRRDTE